MAFVAGDLRHPVYILHRVEDTPLSNGRQMWHYDQDDEIMWCRVTDVSGRDFYAATQANAEDIVTFTARAGYTVGNQDRLSYNGLAYEIVATNHLGYAGDFVQYRCRWLGAKGSRVMADGTR